MEWFNTTLMKYKKLISKEWNWLYQFIRKCHISHNKLRRNYLFSEAHVTWQFRPDTCRINIQTTKQLQWWYFSVKTVCCLVLILTPKGKTDEMIFTLSGYGWCLLHSCILYYTMLISNSHLGFEMFKIRHLHIFTEAKQTIRKC